MADSPSKQEQERAAANRLGLEYRKPPPRAYAGPMVDVHTHVHAGPQLRTFWEAAQLYGVRHVLSMTPLDDVSAVFDALGDAVSFIAIPNWRAMKKPLGDEFRSQWIADLGTFRRRGARLCKFWMAPRMRKEHNVTLDSQWLRPVLDAALDLEYRFLVHVGDPSVWWLPGKPYHKDPAVGAKAEQYKQLEWFAERVNPRRVIAAHMGGYVEDPEFLARLLDRHANLYLDSSATKWIVREVARRPQRVRDFLTRYPERVLFGSDLVASEKFTSFDHYASRYWAQVQMWESSYVGQSPIEDPDADDPPQLRGLSLPADVLARLYRENALALGLVEGHRR